MPKRPPKKPWNANRPDLYAPPKPQPPVERAPLRGDMGHLIPAPATWHVERVTVGADGKEQRELVLLGGVPWSGSEARARAEAQRRQVAEPGAPHEAVPARVVR